MKKFYILLNILLLVAAVLLLNAHFSLKPAPPEKALKRTPKLKKNTARPLPPKRQKLPSAAEISRHNLFDPLRGKQEKQEAAKTTQPIMNKPKLELVGICRFGAVAGAIIIDKGVSRSPRYRRRSTRNRNSSPTAKNKPKKRYFKLGEAVSNGFSLKDIKTDTVTLQRGHETMELKLGRSRFGALASTPTPRKVPTSRSTRRAVPTYRRPTVNKRPVPRRYSYRNRSPRTNHNPEKKL